MFGLVLVAFLVISGCTIATQRDGIDEIRTGCTLTDLRDDAVTPGKGATITGLNLHNCSLPSLPNGTFEKWNLKSLIIRNSNVSVVDGDVFGDLENIRQLKLIGNRVRHVEAWSKNDLTELEEIDLSQNEISEIDVNALCRYPNLLIFKADRNAIERLVDGTFKCVSRIRELNFGDNRIAVLESFTFSGLTQLVELSLENNRIDYVNPYAFASTTSLRVLRLNGNQFKAIESRTFNTLLKLNYLNVSGNSLAKIEDDTFELNVELKVLDVSYNQLDQISADSLRGLKNLEVRSLNIILT